MPLTPSPEQQAFKAAMRHQWDRSAQGWNDHAAQIGAWLARGTEAMLEMAGVKPGARVLDVAAGAGEQTLLVAERVGPTGSVLATDLSPAIVALAQANAERAGHRNVRTQVADGESLGLAPASFDAAVCRLGLMFFPNPLQGLLEMHHALRPGGGVCTMVFSRPERNPCITILMSTALKHAGLAPRDPYQAGRSAEPGAPRTGRRAVPAGRVQRSRDHRHRRTVHTALRAPLRRLHSQLGQPGPADSRPARRPGRRGGLGRDRRAPRGLQHRQRLAGPERAATDGGPALNCRAATRDAAALRQLRPGALGCPGHPWRQR